MHNSEKIPYFVLTFGRYSLPSQPELGRRLFSVHGIVLRCDFEFLLRLYQCSRYSVSAPLRAIFCQERARDGMSDDALCGVPDAIDLIITFFDSMMTDWESVATAYHKYGSL